ncbi:hypothetical protein A4249_07565 [Brevundimonas sp. GW460-12-10-14-LB2]|jgi:hypothetical protein|uniref:hypothetical protein n=1 Tax=Brevundimonas TaxID=41275 RepID=UPI0007BCBD83|nr:MULTISPECIES: hypothetical protein [Brevundimonas]ANC53530.1 hypothetical protein A4249_07565 [Brevundimonas sp. GW460-12-10-14-LB2]
MMEANRAARGWAKVIIAGFFATILELQLRQSGGSLLWLLHAASMILKGMGDWFSELGAIAPVAALITLFCLDGFFSGFRK